MRNQAQFLLKRSCTLGKLVNVHTKGITLLCIGKNNICISCVFNGFKWVLQENIHDWAICYITMCILIIARQAKSSTWFELLGFMLSRTRCVSYELYTG